MVAIYTFIRQFNFEIHFIRVYSADTFLSKNNNVFSAEKYMTIENTYIHIFCHFIVALKIKYWLLYVLTASWVTRCVAAVAASRPAIAASCGTAFVAMTTVVITTDTATATVIIVIIVIVVIIVSTVIINQLFV